MASSCEVCIFLCGIEVCWQNISCELRHYYCNFTFAGNQGPKQPGTQVLFRKLSPKIRDEWSPEK